MFTCVLGRCAWTLCCFHSSVSTRTFRRPLTASVDSCAEIKIECPFSGVISWRSVAGGAGKRCREWGHKESRQCRVYRCHEAVVTAGLPLYRFFVPYCLMAYN